MEYDYLKNKNIGILGLGKTGLATYKFLSNYHVNLFAWDDNESVSETYKNKGYNIINIKDWDFKNLDFVIVSPGIPIDHPKKHIIREKSDEFNFEIICDIELFIRLNPNKKYIGITGTNGKSTTTALINHILVTNNYKSTVAGNIGIAIFDTDITKYDYFILELSSYQLDLMKSHKLDCAMILNIQPDHLEHHGSLENYISAKNKIFHNQSKDNLAMFFQDYEIHSKQYITGKELLVCNMFVKSGIYYYEDALYDNFFEENKKILDFKSLIYLKGEHNQQNISFSYACCRFLGLKNNQIIEAISTFKGLLHRQTLVRKINNISFINDSKATNCESTEQALKAFENIYLILGGKRKTDNLDPILPYFNKVIHTFLIGSSEDIFANILSKNLLPYTKCQTLDIAVKKAYEMAKNNQNDSVVLLSPACASFDQFQNFEQRGDIFIQIVESL
jgi:UDP-N-acetylmuramoylalanine--D-glutamate ligase